MALRSIEFTNGEAETTVFGTSPYLIVRVEGLGIPGVDTFQQKAPNQDGTTYIDSLLQNRDLVIELAITTPNAFMDIAAYRRQLSQRLCPKYGVGSLLYTDEAGHQYKLSARAASVVFPNKDYRDPYARAQITFTAHEPYWRDVNAKTGTLPTSVTSAPSVINGAVSNALSVIELSDGNIFIAYIRDSDKYLVSRTYTTSWSGESVINGTLCNFPSVMQLSNGNLFIAYRNVSGNIVSRTYTSSWSAEATINAANSEQPSVIELANGNLFIAYVRTADNFIVCRTYTTSWSSESVINAASSAYPTVIQRTDGSLFIAYSRLSDYYLLSRIYVASWESEAVINSATSYFPSVMERSDGSLYIAYRGASGYLVARTYKTTWNGETVINAATTASPSVIELTNKSLYIAYIRNSDNYLVSVARSVTPAPAVITGDVSAPIKVTFQGPSVNPRIIKQNTLEYIRLNTTLAATDSFIVDTTFGNKTVKLLQGGIEKNGIAFLDIGSTFFSLDRPTLPALPIGVDPWYGNIAHYNMDSVPEIPDDPAGVTYLQDAWATVDGWTATGGAGVTQPTVADGKLIIPTTSLGAQRSMATAPAISDPQGKTWRLEFTVTVLGNSTIQFYYRTSGGSILFDTKTIVLGKNILNVVVPSGAAVTYLAFAVNTNTVGMVDFIYIGTGAYLPNSLLDSSGNANHGTIFGATPVEGISGRALAFDGVNDNCIIARLSSYFGVGRVVAVSGWFTPKTASGTQMFSYPDSTNNNIFYISILNASTVNFSANNNISVAIPLATNERAFLVCIRDNVTGILYAYKNSIFVGQATSTPPTVLGVLSVYLGSINATGGYAACEIDEPRIYNRALNAEEVLFLYQNPDTALPVDADVVYYEDDSVASTAVATLEYTERFAGI